MNDPKHSHPHLHGLSHSHDHEHVGPEHHVHEHEHGLEHHVQGHDLCGRPFPHLHAGDRVLTVRAASGLSGDMLLCGLAIMNGLHEGDSGKAELDALINELGVPALSGCVRIEPKSINEVGGWHAGVDLPHEHAHRTYRDIAEIIRSSVMREDAKNYALEAFRLLAEAEGGVHGKIADEVTFHEVGALDSILDMCLVCSLYAKLAPVALVCSPLPLADGSIHCAHGQLPSPAPAVLKLLRGVPVCGFSGKGETVTPTAIALLKALGAHFGDWPRMVVRESAIVYGGKVFENAPNGSIWSLGEAL